MVLYGKSRERLAFFVDTTYVLFCLVSLKDSLRSYQSCCNFLQWVVTGAVDVDIGANPSAEGGGEDEGVDDQAVKVVDIVDTFRLQVCSLL